MGPTPDEACLNIAADKGPTRDSARRFLYREIMESGRAG